MLSMMAKGFFAKSPLLVFPILALLLFMVVFTIITIRALRTDKDTVRAMAGMPLTDDLFPERDNSEGTRQ